MTGPMQGTQPRQNVGQVSTFPGVDLQTAHASSDQPAALKLVRQLQTTLELGNVIELFLTETALLLAQDGAAYRCPITQEQFEYGVQARHKISYHLKLMEQDLGEISFSRKKRFAKAEIEKLESLLVTLLYPLRNALLYRNAVQSAFIDALTGVKNRAAFESNYNREIEINRRKSTDLSLIVFDIDFFKRVNDRFGHAVGDLVLRNIAQAVEATIRCSDALYRYGGEEFVVVLNGTDRAGAQLLAERIRKNVEGLVFTSPKGMQVTLSLGVATLMEDDTPARLFERADAALYQAKGDGRNRVVNAEQALAS